MEEKVSVLEGLGAVKGFLSGAHWSFIHGTKDLSLSTSKNQQLQNIEVDVTAQQNTSLNQNSEKCKTNTSKVLKSTQDSVTRKLESVMEKNKSDNDIPNDWEKDKEDKLNNNHNEKTDIEKSNHKKSLILFSDSNNSNSLESACKSVEEFESGASDDLKNENIPNDEIPSSVLEWVNHLPSKGKRSKRNVEWRDSKEEDSENSNMAEEFTTVTARLSREASVQSNSSFDSLLDSRRPDPVEIFLNLGFGGVPGVNMENCRIPKRFLVPSKCKGGDWNEFLKRELLQAQNFECSSLGFRGLSDAFPLLQKLKNCPVQF